MSAKSANISARPDFTPKKRAPNCRSASQREGAQGVTQLVGRTGGDHVVVFDGETDLKGHLLDVTVVDARNMTLFATPVHAAALTRGECGVS